LKFDIIGLFSFIADIATLLTFIKFYKVARVKIFAILFAYSILSVGLDFLAASSSDKLQQLVSFYSIMVEVVVLAIIYFFIVHKPLYKIIIVVSLIGFLMFSVTQWDTTGAAGFSTWLASSAVLFALVLSLLAFADLFIEVKNDFLLKKPAIWIIFAYIIYAAGNLFLFATTESFVDIFVEPGFWRIFFIANIIKNAFFINAILIQKKILLKETK
jgi:hypothetical protein